MRVLDKFADNTFTRELDDLQAVLEAIEEGTLPEALLDPDRDDESVGFRAAETLAGTTDTAELMEASGGHTFGGAHPFEGPVPETLETV